MKFKNICLAIMLSGTLTISTFAQDLPQPSPKAVITQTVGLTDITIEYSSPAVKGREIWGGLVPYNEMWRTGANRPTKISFSKDVTVEGKKVPAGTYVLFTIPSKDEWTIIINNDVNLTSLASYKQDNDVARFKVKPQASPLRERMAILVTDFSDDDAVISIEWEKLKIPFKVTLGTSGQAIESINSSLGSTWRTYANSARYLLENKKDLDKALGYINTSISLSNEWFNNWIKAQILFEQKQYKDAYKFAQIAKELGDKSDYFFFKTQVEKALVDWKGKK